MMARKEADGPLPVSFADAFKELEGIIQQLESGQISLEESMKLYEQGQNLLKRCSKILDDTELRVRQLTRADADEQDVKE